MKSKEEDRGFVFVRYERCNEQGKYDRLYEVGGPFTIGGYLKLCEEYFPGYLMNFARGLHNEKYSPDILLKKINAHLGVDKKEEPKAKKEKMAEVSNNKSLLKTASEQPKDVYAECREQAFQLSDLMGDLLKGLGMPNSDDFVAKMKSAAVKAEENLRTKNNKAESSQKENKTTPLNESRIKSLRDKIQQQVNIALGPVKGRGLAIGVIGFEDIDDFLNTVLDEEQNSEPEYEPMDCNHQCLSCKCINTCQTLKSAMDNKDKNNLLQ